MIGRNLRSKSGLLGGADPNKLSFIAIELSGDDIQGIKTIVASYARTTLTSLQKLFATGRLMIVRGQMQKDFGLDPLSVGFGAGEDALPILFDTNFDRFGMHYIWFEAGEMESLSGEYLTVILTPAYLEDDASGSPSETLGRLSVSGYREVRGRGTTLEAQP